MSRWKKGGSLLLGLALAGFGIIQLATRRFLQGLLPFGELPVHRVWINVTALLFLITGILLVLRKRLPYATATGSLLFFLFFLYPHLSGLVADIHNGSKWTGTFECLSIANGILLSGIVQQVYGSRLPVWVSLAVRYIFGLCLLVFGIQHFMYAAFIATLLPGWIPFHLFWAYFVGVAFTATAVSLFLNVLIRLSCTLLAIMFFAWVLILHAPRVVASPAKEPEWTSMLVALAMGAIALQGSFLSISEKVAKRTSVKDEEFIIHT